MNFVIYDTETSSLDPNFGQIFQFAAQLTDQDFNVIEEFEIRSRRMPHIVPSPGALIVTDVNPNTLEQAEHSYYEFAKTIKNKLLSWSPAIICGYNIINFDERYLRSLFYQNLYPPYLTQTNGNSRLDILSLVRAAEHLQPSLLAHPKNQKGKTSKKLEDVAAANGFDDHQAHDAMGDVKATVHLAKIIKSCSPVLWNRALASKSRSAFNRLLSQDNPIIIHDHNRGCPVSYPAIKIGKVHNGRNTLFFDLRCDPDQIDLGDTEKCFRGREKPFRICKDSEIPLTFTPTDWHELGLEPNFKSHLAFEKVFEIESKIDNDAIIDRFNESQKTYDESPYIEAQIYDDFHAFDDEKWLMNDFHQADPELKKTLATRFKDERFSSFAKRIIFDNYKDILSPERVTEYNAKIMERRHSNEEVPWMTIPKALTECDRLVAEGDRNKPDVEIIRQYLLSL